MTFGEAKMLDASELVATLVDSDAGREFVLGVVELCCSTNELEERVGELERLLAESQAEQSRAVAELCERTAERDRLLERLEPPRDLPGWGK